MAEQLYNGTQAAELATQWRRILTADAAAVSRSAICNWVTRGYLPIAGLDERGHPLYRHADLAHAELTTRHHALRLAGISTRAYEPTPDHSYGSGQEGTAAREHPTPPGSHTTEHRVTNGQQPARTHP